MTSNLLVNWKKAREDDVGFRIRRQAYTRKWSKPQKGWMKINIDAARQDSQYVGVGCVVRDEWGHFFKARTNTVRS